MFPNGTMTHTSGVFAGLGPVVAIGLQMVGVGECTPESVEMGCVGAAQLSGAIMTIVGVVGVIVGRIRAKRTAAAELAAAKRAQ